MSIFFGGGYAYFGSGSLLPAFNQSGSFLIKAGAGAEIRFYRAGSCAGGYRNGL